ncbi:hypothetical protein [uncultured Phascolarctobacterium sp.]|uniref:hypothetical protein n=1 Tax=uncultured Phascolarctobacterium sp. TaxID=512296 RepID=UPI0015B2FEC6|nr:hypothetical protein [uncultured Phascolarctobacterium sp.]
MQRRIFLWLMLCLVLTCPTVFAGGVNLEAVYPYSLEHKDIHKTMGGSTNPLYLNIESFDDPNPQKVKVEITLPAGMLFNADKDWQEIKTASGSIIQREWLLPADYGQNFDLLYLRADTGLRDGSYKIAIKVSGKDWEEHKLISFEHESDESNIITAIGNGEDVVLDKSKFNWYIQSITLPVDNLGNKDDRIKAGTIYIKDTALESFRNRMTGDGATNWAAVFNHPAAHLLLEMRNPQQDIRILKFRAELVDKYTGEPAIGLCTASQSDNETEQGWGGLAGSDDASTAMISLDGKKSQSFILPLYVDYFRAVEGEYNLKVTVFGNGQEKIQEVPITIAKKRSMGLFAVGFSFCCLLLVCLTIGKLKKCIFNIGAKGAITIALFAAVAFGSIVVPTTLLGDLLQVVLGPFSGLVTGILNGVLLYLLVMSLLVIYRKPGIVALMFLLKWMLAGLMFGRFTPLGVLSYMVYIVVLESTLYLSGFYTKKELTAGYILLVSVLIGVADAFITMINLEQRMFFYRLYYADWYIGLYMLINGLLYSSIGSWLGYKVGTKLQQVMGE